MRFLKLYLIIMFPFSLVSTTGRHKNVHRMQHQIIRSASVKLQVVHSLMMLSKYQISGLLGPVWYWGGGATSIKQKYNYYLTKMLSKKLLRNWYVAVFPGIYLLGRSYVWDAGVQHPPPGQISICQSSKSYIQSAIWEKPLIGIRAVLCDSKKPRPKSHAHQSANLELAPP